MRLGRFSSVGWLCAASTLGLILLAPRFAFGQNHATVPLGGRTATMGGAATAAGNDSAMPYLNPAGLAGLPGDIFAVSATVYGVRYANYGGIFMPGGGPGQFGTLAVDRSEATTQSTFELPSSVMYFKHLSAPNAPTQHRVGIALTIPQAMQRNLVSNFSGTFRGSVVGNILAKDSFTEMQTRTVYYLGPSYAVGFRGVRLGLSAFAVYSQTRLSRGYSSTLDVPGASLPQSGDVALTSDGLGFVPVVGAQFEVARHFWLGFGAAPPSVPLSGSARQVSRSTMTLPGPSGSGVVRTAESVSAGSRRDQTPWRFNVGVAYEDRERFTLSADISAYGSVSEAWRFRYNEVRTESQSGDLSRTVRTSGTASDSLTSVVNVAVGGEVVLNPLVALRGGVFTDRAPYGAVGTTADYAYSQRVDRYGGTLGVGLKFGSFDTTLGTVLTYGDGKFGAPDSAYQYSGGTPVVPVAFNEWSAMFLLSGAVTEDKAKEIMSRYTGIPLPGLNTTRTQELPKYEPPPWGPANLQDPAYSRGAPLASAPSAVPSPATPAPIGGNPANPTAGGTDLDRALERLRGGDPLNARQYAQSALTACGQGCSSAQIARAHMYIGVAQARLGNTAEMAAEFKQAVEQEPALVLDPSIADDATQRAFQEASNHARVQPPASP